MLQLNVLVEFSKLLLDLKLTLEKKIGSLLLISVKKDVPGRSLPYYDLITLIVFLLNCFLFLYYVNGSLIDL